MPKWLFALLLTALILFQLRNAWLYPITKGFDATAHIEYITILKTERRLPLANEGWELFQPPLYYFIAALLPSLKATQLQHVLYYALLLGATYLCLLRFFSPSASRLGTVLVAITPLSLYMTPPISNEFFSMVMITCLLATYVWFRARPQTVKSALILGFMIGIALLSKATALVAVAAIFIDQFLILRTEKIRVSWPFVLRWLMVMAIATLIGGWFYLRNIWYFGNPLIAAADLIPLQSFAQPIINRTPLFLINPLPFVTLDIFNAASQSLIAGTYFTWFYDAKNVVAPVQAFSKAAMLILLLSYPITGVMLRGVIRVIKERDSSARFFGLYGILMLASYIAYNYRLPFDSTVKACFIGSLLMPFSYFFLKGYQILPMWLKKLAIPYLLVYMAITVRHFWIQSWWQ